MANGTWMGLPTRGVPGTHPSSSGDIPHISQYSYYGEADGNDDGLGPLQVVVVPLSSDGTFPGDPPPEFQAPTYHRSDAGDPGAAGRITAKFDSSGVCTSAGIAGGTVNGVDGMYNYNKGDQSGSPTGSWVPPGKPVGVAPISAEAAAVTNAGKLARIAAIVLSR